MNPIEQLIQDYKVQIKSCTETINETSEKDDLVKQIARRGVFNKVVSDLERLKKEMEVANG
jgi:hypothetical protein